MSHDPWGEFVEEARTALRAAESSLGLPAAVDRFEDPPEGMGDLAIPAFPYAKHAKRPPADVARDLAEAMSPGPRFSKVEAAGPYVNLTIDPDALVGRTMEVVRTRGDAYGSHPPNGRRLLLEHTSINPTGPIHVGRARNPIIGDALARIFRMAGYDVTTEFLVNDIGRQMVLLAWGAENIPEAEREAPERERDDYRLVRAYQAANARVEADGELNRQIEERIYRLENGDADLTRATRAVAERVLEGMRATLERLGIRFDSYFWESDLLLGGRVAPVIERLRALPEAAVEDGGAFVDLASFGVKGRDTKFFFSRKDGTSLYPTRDVAYHLDKFGRCDEAITVLGEDQRLANTQLRAALSLLKAGQDVEPIFYAHVALPEGRMSTRAGRVVHMDDLIEEAVERAYAEVSRRREDLPDPRKREIAEFVGVGALRYNIGRVQAEKRITFVWDEALNFEGDSAPFLQYAHARASGILAKAGEVSGTAGGSVTHEQETRLARAIARLPSAVASCAEGRRVHPMAAYAYGLAGTFNAFYRDCPVLHAEEPVRTFRLSLVQGARAALGAALGALGLAAPDEM